DELLAEHTTPQNQTEQAQQATQAGVQTTSTQGTDLAQEEEQPQEEEEPDTSTNDQDPEPTGQGGTCEASFYGADLAGSATANGETFDQAGAVEGGVAGACLPCGFWVLGVGGGVREIG